MAAKKPTITRVRIAREELDKMTKEDLQKCWNLQDQYVDLLEAKLNSNSEHTELLSLRESTVRLQQRDAEATRKENILVLRLTTKEHEMQEFAGQIQELKQAQIPTMAQLRSALLDPAVNLLFERMRKEMDTLKAQLEETQNELSAWKFTPDSNTGKRLMAKCRLLYQENEELGKIISSGRMAKLEGDLALQKSFSEEMKKSQSELDEFLLELDEDVEGMQSTIYYLQQQLREAKEQISQLQKEKSGENGLSNSSPVNSVENNNESNCKSPELHFSPKSDITPPLTSPNDLNGLENKSVTKNRPISPNDTDQTNSPKHSENLTVVTNIPAQNINSQENSPELSAVTVDSHVTPIITNNIVVNHDKHTVENKTTSVQDSEMDSSETSSLTTNDHNLEEKTTENALENSKDFEVVQSKTLSTGKKTPESVKGRKRTRPHTPVEPDSKEESSLPVRKRTRRREAELLQIADDKQTPVEINTDAEFQAAHTLASWASKQERTEGQSDVTSNAIGNGEISKEDSEPQ